MSVFGRCEPVLAVLLVVGCASPSVIRSSDDLLIRASTEQLAAKAERVVHDYGPRVSSVMGTNRSRRLVIDLGWREKPRPRSRFEAWTSSHGIVVYGPDFRESTLVHELVHWHLVGPWKACPQVIEEGIAYIVSWQLTKDVDFAGVNAPLPLDFSLLSLSFEEYANLEEIDKAITFGLWVVGTLGLDKIRELSLRALEEGRSTIPSEWIIREIPFPYGPAAFPVLPAGP